jgi:hypothetical protein
MSEQRRAFTTAVEDVLWKVRRDSSASSTTPCGRALVNNAPVARAAARGTERGRHEKK